MTDFGFNLIGNRFIVNIAQPENSPGGLFVVNRDPRKHRIPPDAYVGIVEKVGPTCQFLYPGQKVVVRRWIYRQHDIDDERLLAYESQVLILDETKPYPGVVVLKLIEQPVATSLIIPDTIKDRKKKAPAYHGRVVASGSNSFKENDLLWVERRDRGQYFLGHDVLVFKDEIDSFGGMGPVLMKGVRVPQFEVVA